jgi:hypothetical protein
VQRHAALELGPEHLGMALQDRLHYLRPGREVPGGELPLENLVPQRCPALLGDPNAKPDAGRQDGQDDEAHQPEAKAPGRAKYG